MITLGNATNLVEFMSFEGIRVQFIATLIRDARPICWGTIFIACYFQGEPTVFDSISSVLVTCIDSVHPWPNIFPFLDLPNPSIGDFFIFRNHGPQILRLENSEIFGRVRRGLWRTELSWHHSVSAEWWIPMFPLITQNIQRTTYKARDDERSTSAKQSVSQPASLLPVLYPFTFLIPKSFQTAFLGGPNSCWSFRSIIPWLN